MESDKHDKDYDDEDEELLEIVGQNYLLGTGKGPLDTIISWLVPGTPGSLVLGACSSVTGVTTSSVKYS